MLGRIGNRRDVYRLIQASKDKAWNVRDSAVISLGCWKSKNVQQVIMDLLFSDPHRVVRRDAALSLPKVLGFNAQIVLQEALIREREPLTRVGILYGLYLSGARHYLSDYLDLLKFDDLLVNNNVVNCIEIDEIVPDDREMVVQALQRYITTDIAEGIKDDAVIKIDGLRCGELYE
jgi:hypothetical protein